MVQPKSSLIMYYPHTQTLIGLSHIGGNFNSKISFSMSNFWQNFTKKKTSKLSWTCTRKTRKWKNKIKISIFLLKNNKIFTKKKHIVGTKSLIEMMYYDVIWGKSLGWTTTLY